MKILLILPPETHLITEAPIVQPPLGLLYLASVLQKEGHYVEILDCIVENWRTIVRRKKFVHIGIDWKEIERRVRASNPDMVGISCLFTCQLDNALTIAKIVKETINVPVVMGGSHPSALPKETLQNKNVDYVIIGEGENSFAQLIKGEPVSLIDGIGYRVREEIRVNPKRRYIENLDELPFPARHLVPMKEYFRANMTHASYSKRQPATSIITSRGCPKKCVFCSIHTIWGYEWRARSPKNVVDEIETLIQNYGMQEIHFEDDNLTLNGTRMKEICLEILKRKIDISWTTPNGVAIETLTPELLALMKKSGCYALSLGIESGNEYILNSVMKKGLKLETVERVIKWAKEAEIETYGFFVLGVPTETRETIEDTIRFAKKLDLDLASFFVATPYPGTDLYEVCREKGYLKWNGNPVTLTPTQPVIETEMLEQKDLANLQKKAYIEFEVHRLLNHPIRYFTKPRSLKRIIQYLKVRL